ncbi:PARP catalytic domain protein [Stanieria cyanosphaera PCC 7437]|uniref:NAD(+) ADP-ribosyltransferase n=1 Tax=Stanieria cyanosphaera (strain ATCC 29371 / PCC 7437) TaxID=111780 RepID=K9XWE7_STAC7|nr:WGR domain-containing protein [Stanieria cyanosphaera]AFZ36394.1 PARP catalytic domain protein [Stanieria cyanosphaera PCC 7437]
MSTAVVAGVLDCCTLIYVEIDQNSNKVWQGKVTDDGCFTAQWGRVGSKLQSKTYQFSSVLLAKNKFERMKREKLRKGYTEAQLIPNQQPQTTTISSEDLESIAAKQIHHGGDVRSKQLIRYLVSVNIHEIIAQTNINYDVSTGKFTTALGLITPNAIALARDYLLQIAAMKRSNSRIFRQLISQYLRLIPQNLGRKLDESVFRSPQELQRQYEILNALDAALATTQPSMKEKIFECTLTRVPGSTTEGKNTFRWLRQLYESTLNTHHLASQYKLRRVYEINIPSMRRAFSKKAAEVGNVKLHWHGTKASNLLSILQQGLIIPPANAIQCTGRMFGNGIYGSQQSTKALNYATNYWNQSGDNEQRVFMLLCEFAMGKEYHPHNWSQNLPKKGYDSTYVTPGIAGVINQESIVYSTEQVNLKYLCEFV